VVPGASGRRTQVPDLSALIGRLGRPFTDEGLLLQALSHRSWCAEAGGRPSNERLEYLGDAVLGLVVAEHCYRTYVEMPEGALAKVRAAVVNTSVLAEVAVELDLGPVLLLGRGEDSSGGRAKPSILANAVEAVIAAVYLDGGFETATGFVLGLLDHRIEEAAAGPGAEDFKTRLQEMVVRRVGKLPQYEVAGTGPDHARRYTATVIVGGVVVGEGEGRSKKDAEQAAARAALPQFAPMTPTGPTSSGPSSSGATSSGSTSSGPTSSGPTSTGSETDDRERSDGDVRTHA
jgi:ribonuclease-3